MVDIDEKQKTFDQAFDAVVAEIQNVKDSDPKKAMALASHLLAVVNDMKADIDTLLTDIDDAGAAIGAWNNDDDQDNEAPF